MEKPFWNRSITLPPRDAVSHFLERKSVRGTETDALSFEEHYRDLQRFNKHWDWLINFSKLRLRPNIIWWCKFFIFFSSKKLKIILYNYINNQMYKFLYYFIFKMRLAFNFFIILDIVKGFYIRMKLLNLYSSVYQFHFYSEIFFLKLRILCFASFCSYFLFLKAENMKKRRRKML